MGVTNDFSVPLYPEGSQVTLGFCWTNREIGWSRRKSGETVLGWMERIASSVGPKASLLDRLLDRIHEMDEFDQEPEE